MHWRNLKFTYVMYAFRLPDTVEHGLRYKLSAALSANTVDRFNLRASSFLFRTNYTKGLDIPVKIKYKMSSYISVKLS